MFQDVLKTAALALVLGVCVTAQPVSNNTSETPECTSSTECSSGKDCIEEKCVDPCEGACGQNTVCHLVNLEPMCECKPGFVGHPFTGCSIGPGVECVSDSQCSSEKACVRHVCVNPCQGACGLNTECRVIGHRFKCACKQGFHYDSIGCVPTDQPDCKTNAHCTEDLACVNQKCVDPCEGVCGNNTVCHVTNHYPACACSPGFTGDAFLECKPLCLPLLETKRKFPRANKAGLEKKFSLSDVSLTWAEAAANCISQDMALAAIEIEEDQRNVQLVLQKIEDAVYTSGWSDLGRPDQFVWTTTGNPFGYSNWQTGEPSGAGYHCLLIRTPSWSFKWLSLACSERRRFVCQYYE